MPEPSAVSTVSEGEYPMKPRVQGLTKVQGWYQALIEARIPFEMVHDGLLDAEHLEPFKCLILPNIAALSDAQCDQLRTFVERGGSIVASSESPR